MKNEMYHKLIKSFHTGFDIGNTFFNNLHDRGDMLARYDHKDLRILAPKYFIEIIKQEYSRYMAQPASPDPDGMFRFMGIELQPGPYEKIIIYHVDYPLLKKEDMYHEFDLSIFVTQHNKG